MKTYELDILISQDLSENELQSLEEKIRLLIENKGGLLININKTIKKLAYPIKKKLEVCLLSLSFKLPPEKLLEVEKELKTEKNILRFFITYKKPLKEIPQILAKKPVRKIKTPKPKKVELEKIEQKLEEILNEP